MLLVSQPFPKKISCLNKHIHILCLKFDCVFVDKTLLYVYRWLGVQKPLICIELFRSFNHIFNFLNCFSENIFTYITNELQIIESFSYSSMDANGNKSFHFLSIVYASMGGLAYISFVLSSFTPYYIPFNLS